RSRRNLAPLDSLCILDSSELRSKGMRPAYEGFGDVCRQGRVVSSTLTVSGLPSRMTVTSTSSPGFFSRSRKVKSTSVFTGFPSEPPLPSPARRPAPPCRPVPPAPRNLHPARLLPAEVGAQTEVGPVPADRARVAGGPSVGGLGRRDVLRTLRYTGETRGQL